MSEAIIRQLSKLQVLLYFFNPTVNTFFSLALESPSEPYVSLSTHTAPSPTDGNIPNFQCANKIQMCIRDRLPGSEDLTVGQQVYRSHQFGQPYPVKVTAKDEKNITFDANHEMAGKELNFKIELVEVK